MVHIFSVSQSSKILGFLCVLKKKIDVGDESCDYGLKDALFTASKVGDVNALCSLLQLPEEMAESPEQLQSSASVVSSPLTLLNKPIDSSGFTLLHIAAAAAQKAAVRLLLYAGADPACRYSMKSYLQMFAQVYVNALNFITDWNTDLLFPFTGITKDRLHILSLQTKTQEMSFVNTWVRIPTSTTTPKHR